MKRIASVFLMILISASISLSQVAINTDGSAPEASAMLDVKSTNKGVLLPRMTNAQIQLITSPANGLFVYSTDDSKVYCFNTGDYEWKEIEYGAGTIAAWTCGDVFIDTRDAIAYNTIQIGMQCWMSENLNIGTRIDGINDQIDNGTIEKYCYDDDDANCNTYGGLYQWDEMMQYVTTEGSQGICPSGWHIPTDDEFKQMEITLGMSQYEAGNAGWRGTNEGGKMKETGTSHWITPNTDATNESGLTALPGGSNLGNTFGDLGGGNSLSTSSGTTETNKWYRYLAYYSGQVYRSSNHKLYSKSVRCIIQQ